MVGLTYKDFEIAIIGDNENQPWYTWTTYGDARVAGTLVFRNGNAWLKELLEKLDKGSIDGTELRDVGQEMYASLFSDKVGKLFNKAESELPPNSGLRVNINIQPPPLHRLPWEFLYDDKYFAIFCKTPVVRKLPTLKSENTVKISKKLKILVLISNPNDQIPLNVQREADYIKSEFEKLVDSGYAELKIVTQATQEKLENILRDTFDIFHFIGHAGLDTSTHKGLIILEDNRGKSKLYDAEILGALLNGAGIKMAILNACDTAKSAENGHMLGVGHSLLHAGIPIVIAMQFKIPDKAAILFTKRFYMEMARGEQLDTALTRARQSIGGETGIDRKDWGIPVLYEANSENFQFRPVSKRVLKHDISQKTSPHKINVGICDINSLLINMESITREMNSTQKYFYFKVIPGFYTVEMFQRHNTQIVCDFKKASHHFKMVFEKHTDQGLKMIIGVTQNLISDAGVHDHFSVSSPVLTLISTYDLERYALEAHKSLEQAVMYLILGSLAATFGNIGYHQQTRTCLMDYCDERDDMVKGLANPHLEDSCKSKISDKSLLSALDAMLQYISTK